MHGLTASNAWSSRLVVERGVAVVYIVAFAVARNQFRPLLGEHGLLPVPRFVARTGFRRAPSLFQWHYSDRLLGAVAWVGALLSAALAAGLADRLPVWAPIPLWLLLWALYLSIVNVGQIFYGFGWESLLLESGFLAAFLGNSRVGPPAIGIWLLRWLVFRLEFGAGLIKLRATGAGGS